MSASNITKQAAVNFRAQLSGRDHPTTPPALATLDDVIRSFDTVAPPGVLHPKFNLVIKQFASVCPAGLHSNKADILVDGLTQFDAAGSIVKTEVVCLEFIAPAAGLSGQIKVGNYLEKAAWAFCDQPGIFKRNGAANEFGSLNYGARFWDTKAGSAALANLVPGQKYWLCGAMIDIAKFNAGEVEAQQHYVRPGENYRWHARFDTRTVP